MVTSDCSAVMLGKLGHIPTVARRARTPWRWRDGHSTHFDGVQMPGMDGFEQRALSAIVRWRNAARKTIVRDGRDGPATGKVPRGGMDAYLSKRSAMPDLAAALTEVVGEAQLPGRRRGPAAWMIM